MRRGHALEATLSLTEAYRLRAAFAGGSLDTVHEGLLTILALGTDGEIAFGYTATKLTDWKGNRGLATYDAYVRDKGEESFLPWLLRGTFLVNWAWAARSARTIDHVSRGAYVEFRRRLVLAKADLSKALSMSTHGEIFASMLKVSVGEEWSDEESANLFNAAVSGSSPLHWGVWSSRLNKVTCKWGGSHEEMFALAHRARREAPEGHYLHALTALAHAERYLFFSMSDEENERDQRAYFGQQAVVDDILAAYRALRGSESTRQGEDLDRAHELFALVFWKMWRCSGKRNASFSDIARRELALTNTPAQDLGYEWAWLTDKSVSAAHSMVAGDL